MVHFGFVVVVLDSGADSCEFVVILLFIFFIMNTCYVVRVRALGICQGGATYVAALWHCLWVRAPKGKNATCLALG